jgi:hypothetical protein
MTAEMSVAGVMQQVQLIQQIMSKCMIDKEHYGTIPGCGEKKTLLKSGAEKLTLTFRMAPDYEIETIDHPHGHQEYRVKCKMSHIGTGNFLGSGVGCASTMETKWRFRKTTTPTGEPIPKDYKENKGAYAAKGLTCRKNEAGEWEWCKIERTEHDNPADNYNTCLKMAKKRALVDAVLTCTAASDIFTQDLEEMVENGVIPAEGSHPPPPATAQKPIQPPQERPATPPPPSTPTPPPAKAKQTAPARQEAPPERERQAARPASNATLPDDEAIVILDKCYPKTTKTGGTRYSCKGKDGQYYATFDTKKFGPFLEEVGGTPTEVWVKFRQTQYGRDIVDIALQGRDTAANMNSVPMETPEEGEDTPF